jgi:fucose permease
MSYCLTNGFGWHNGYRSVSFLQIILTAMLFISLPLWKREKTSENGVSPKNASPRLMQIFKIKGVKFVLSTFFCYCALESTTGLWASSYLVNSRGIDSETAAKFASLFFLGITFGRFLSGFIADKMGDKTLIRLGTGILLLGMALLILPDRSGTAALAGLVIIGFGCAPIYPSIIHSTPANFGEENSQAIIGVQMASAYLGSTFMPPVFGLIADKINIGLYPEYLILFAVLMLITSEMLNKTAGVKLK